MTKIYWLIITVLLASMFHSNFYFSESYDILALNHIDDINFHVHLQAMRESLAAGDWRALFANTGFSYGNIYWTPLLLLTWPIAHWGPDWLTIVVARQLSVIGCAICLLAVYKISRARNYSRNDAALGLVLLATCSGLFYAATCFHNHMFISALILWSLYFLVKPPTRRRFTIAALLFGMALGLKVSVLFALPIFFIFLNRRRAFKIEEWACMDFFSTNLKALLIVLVTAVICFSPTILLWPFGDQTFKEVSLSSLYFMLFVAPKLAIPRESHFFIEIWDNAIINYYHAFVLALGAGSALWLLYRNRNKLLDDVLMPVCFIASTCLIAILGSLTIRDPYFLRFYILPMIFVISFVFVDVAHHQKKSILLIVVAAMNLFLNFSTFKDYIFMQKNLWASPATQSQIRRLAVLREQVQLKADELVYIDSRVIFPFETLERYKKVRYIYDRTIKPPTDGDIYIYSNSLEDLSSEVTKPAPPFEILYTDSDIQIVRIQRDTQL